MPLTDPQRREIEDRFADRRIFVQIAADHDPDLPNTVRSALAEAAHPARVRVGICHRFDERTTADLDEWRDDPRVVVDRVPAGGHRSIGWARARTQALWDHEPYTLQVDAHARFAEGWDDRLVAMLDAVDSDRPILSGPPGAARPVLVPGLLGTIGRFCRDVRYDEGVTAADEAAVMALRAYTHGYDLRAPDECLVWHRDGHPGPGHPGPRGPGSAPASTGGLGGDRTVAAYAHFAGRGRPAPVGAEVRRCP